MKILILTSRFGMGHYCAAQAIKEELLEMDSDVSIDVVDIIQVLFPYIYKIIYGFFNLFICRFSNVYNWINSFATTHEESCLKKRTLTKIDILVGKYHPDLIISTWSACSRYVSAYKEEYGYKTPLYTYITDVTAHDGWIAQGTNMYFVAARSTRDSLISQGVPANKIIVNGMPVRQSFKREITLNKFLDKKEILIMGGGLGLIPEISNILKELYQKGQVSITVITGKNKKLYKKLKDNYPKINVIGYTEEVYRYMKRADLIITKPGGISTFEAIYSTTPLYVIRPFLSQEVGNAQFIEKMGIGKIAWEDDLDIAEDILALINNESVLDHMKYNMELLKSEAGKSKIRDIYERNWKYVDCNIAGSSAIIYNDIWSHSYTPLQSVEYTIKKA